MSNKAYYDTLRHLIPVTVKSYNPVNASAVVRVNANRGDYKIGELLTIPVTVCIPRKALISRRGTYRVHSYAWYNGMDEVKYIVNPSSNFLRYK